LYEPAAVVVKLLEVYMLLPLTAWAALVKNAVPVQLVSVEA
jgi:hypothetical protein